MNKLAQEAVLVGLIERLHARGSWAGETHIQKATYLLRNILEVPFDFDFILYKHGPFSFELRDELTSMRADQLIDRAPQPPPYGPRILTTERGHVLERRFQRTMARFGPRLDWIADQLGDAGVAELEQLATALWVTRELGEDASLTDRAVALNEIKQHVPVETAVIAVKKIDDLREEADLAFPDPA